MFRHCRSLLLSLLVGSALVAMAAPAWSALPPLDAPTLSTANVTQSSVTVKVCAGNSGAPAGFTLQWMTLANYVANGNQWLSSSNDSLCALSLSGQPSYNGNSSSSWSLLPNSCTSDIDLTIGDLIAIDETGTSPSGCGANALQCGTAYVFRAFAHATRLLDGTNVGKSAWSANLNVTTAPCPSTACTFTFGYWTNHCDVGCHQTVAWPAANLTLGTHSYTESQLLQILNNAAGSIPASCGGRWAGNKRGSNGLLTLAHQLIAAKLNALSGAGCAAVTGTGGYIDQADALIGSRVIPPVNSSCDYAKPDDVASLVHQLDNFNNGGLISGCPNHCGGSSVGQFGVQDVIRATWTRVKTLYR